MKKLLTAKLEFDRWFSKYGKAYQGGGGGIGNFTSFNEIYFQAYNGDNNYHKMPSELTDIYNSVLLKMAPEIFKKVGDTINEQIIELRADEIKRLKDQIEKLNSIEV